MNTVDTARGPVATTDLGATLMHEHIVTRSPGVHENWPPLFDRAGILAIAEQKMADLYARGIRAIVDLTTVDLGRDIGLIADVARRSRVHVIVATGVWWMPQRYFSAHGVDHVAQLFIRDITQGIGTSGVKAAIIKCATDTAGVTQVIENVLRASARAQKATGVPISTHTWAAGRTGEAQQAIFAQEGVDLRRVIIGHSGDSDDLGYLRGLMERGSTIGMDRFGLDNFLPTEKRVEVLRPAAGNVQVLQPIAQAPTPTPAEPSIHQEPEKKSNAKIWIITAVVAAALLLILIVFVVLVGLYLYFRAGKL